MNKSERMAEDELRLNRPEMTPTERFRALRGVVIHLLRPGPPKLAPGVQVGHRSIAPRLGAPQPKLVWNERAGKYVWVPGETRTGRCVWCLQPVPNKRFRWHQACNVYYALAEGRSRDGLGLPILPVRLCPCGRPGEQLDHQLSLGLARLGDWRTYVKAFFPPNLAWLCPGCHKTKTAEDRRAQRTAARTKEHDGG